MYEIMIVWKTGKLFLKKKAIKSTFKKVFLSKNIEISINILLNQVSNKRNELHYSNIKQIKIQHHVKRMV